MGSVWDVARKEVEDSLSSRKFLAIVLLFMLISLGSVHLGVSQYQQELENFRSGASSVQPEKPSLISVFSFMFDLNMPVTAALLALLLSYDAVSREREEGTIELLLSYPVYRDEVINGKFAANMFTVSLAFFASLMFSAGYTIYSLGVVPGVEQLSRLSFIWLSTVIYMALFTGVGTLFSTLFRSRWRSLMASAFLLVLFLALPILAQQAAYKIYEFEDRGPSAVRSVETSSSGMVVRETGDRDSERRRRQLVRQKRERFVENVEKLSPASSYRKFAGKMIETSGSGEGFEPTLREDLVSSIGYIFYLISPTSLFFAASYGVFMRQDL